MLLQRALDCQRIGDIAVVSDSQAAFRQFSEEWLHVAQTGAAGCGVAGMANGPGSWQAIENGLFCERVAD